MNEKLKTIRLYGVMGTLFGRTHRLATCNPAEAVHALGILIPGFRRFLANARDRGMAFSIFVGRKNLRDDQLFDLCGEDEIRIAPVLIGAKRGGLFNILLGGILIAAAAFATSGAALTLAATGVWGATASLGFSLLIGGVAQLLTGTQSSLSTKESAENTPSYVFSGVVNTQAQGGPVPLGYGEMIVGSAVISAGIYAEDQQ